MEEKDQVISFRVSPEEAKKIEAAATAQGLGRAEYLRNKALSADSAVGVNDPTAQPSLARILAEIRSTRECLLNIADHALDKKFIAHDQLITIDQHAEAQVKKHAVS